MMAHEERKVSKVKNKWKEKSKKWQKRKYEQGSQKKKAND